MQPHLKRSGMVIPMVVICLVVMAILGVVLIGNATSQYMQTAKVAASLKVREVLLAGLEEAQALAYDRLNRPPRPPAPGAAAPPLPIWHTELLAAIQRSGDAPRGVLVRHDLKAENLLPRTMAIASALGCAITSASVELLGFKRLSVDSRGLFEDGRIYYRDPDRVLDPPEQDAKFTPVKEWIGSLRVRLTVRWDRTQRTMSRVSDVKVIDVSPVAREFALFSFLSSSRQQDNGPGTDDYYKQDLRQGGPVRLFAHAAGRIFVRGPFLVDTVGFPRGQGGPSPPRSQSYWPIVENEWWGWSTIPANHDGLMTRSGPAIVNLGMPPMRPDSSASTRWFVGLVTGRLGSAWVDWFNDDPGHYILDRQRWYCESTDSDRSIFSVWGDPKNGRMEPFRGVLVYYPENRRRNRPGDTSPPADSRRLYLGNSINRPTHENERWVIEPEGGLYATYNVVDYHGWNWIADIKQAYELAQRGQVVGKLGLHWERRYTLSWVRQFVTDLLRGGVIIGPFHLIPAMLIPRHVAESLAVTLASWVGVDWSGRNTLTDVARFTPDSLANAFPPGYRPPARTVTRRYPRLQDLVVRLRQQPMLLDGVLQFEDMSCNRPIAYVGRGMFYSEQRTAPSLTAPISPPAHPDPSSYLTVHHEGPVQQAHGGAAMLNLRAAGAGQTVNAAIYATQGVKPAVPITLNGNLTCGYLNKAQIPGSARLDITYQPPTATGLVSAISPRTAICIDQ